MIRCPRPQRYLAPVAMPRCCNAAVSTFAFTLPQHIGQLRFDFTAMTPRTRTGPPFDGRACWFPTAAAQLDTVAGWL